MLAEVDIKSPRLPVISNVDAKPHYDPNEIREILAKQVVSPVQWETIITAMVKAPEFEKSYELGPGTVCRGIVKRCVFFFISLVLTSVIPSASTHIAHCSSPPPQVREEARGCQRASLIKTERMKFLSALALLFCTPVRLRCDACTQF